MQKIFEFAKKVFSKVGQPRGRRMQNIFEFAKKELSQDAVIACILNEKDENSKKFLQDLIEQNPLKGSEIPEFVKKLDFEVDSVKQQHNSIDVFCVIEEKNDNEKYAVIIEDKTDSSIHDNQVIRYVCNVAKEDNYKGIFFILIKTGLQDFWEPYYYKLEAESLKNRKLDEELIVSGTSREQIINLLEGFKTFNGSIFFCNYNRENFLEFLGNSTWEYSWMDEYKTFLTNNTSNPNWQNNMDIDFGKFKENLVGNCLPDNSGIHCSIYYPSGNGKRDPDIAVEGIYFTKGNINYCLLPGMTLRQGSADLFLHFHVNMNATYRQGYASLKAVKNELKNSFATYQKDRKEMIQKVRQELVNDWIIENEEFSERNYLNMCKKQIKFTEKNPSKNKSVCKAFQEIIKFSLWVQSETP